MRSVEQILEQKRAKQEFASTLVTSLVEDPRIDSEGSNPENDLRRDLLPTRVLELARLNGWIEIQFKPGEQCGGNAAAWALFVAKNGISNLEQALTALEELDATR